MSRQISNNTRLPAIGGTRGSGPQHLLNPAEKVKDPRGTLKKIIQLFKPWTKALSLAVMLTVVSTLLSVVIPYLVGRSFDILMQNSSSALFIQILSIIAALHLANWLTTTGSSWILLFVSSKLIFFFRSRFFAKMQKLPLFFYDTNPHGDTMSRITNDVDNISSTITATTTQLLSALLTIIASLILMFRLNSTLSFTILISLPLVFILTKVVTAKSHEYFYRQQSSLGALNAIIEENINGLKIVKAFNKQQQVLQQFARDNQELFDNAYKAQIWTGYMMPMMNVINNLIFALVALVGGYLAVSGRITVGTVISFLSYSKQFAFPLNGLAGMLNTIQQALASAERVFETLSQMEETPDSPQAQSISQPLGNIIYDKVSFSYQADKPVLKNVSFSVKAGEVIAIVGETGSGKTTIINLLNRFYDADSGTIYLDGIPIKDIKREELRKYFSVVLQETSLFSGTIMDNIRYARPGAGDQEVIAAAQIGQADAFISRLPQAYNTYINAASDNLSEGQKQLLAISRAVLCQCPVLILDEATSFVDTKTEKDIQRALISLMKNHTSFLIAHRLSTIKDADRILVIKNGRIFESGTHQELLKLKGYYYKMVVAQMGHLA